MNMRHIEGEIYLQIHLLKTSLFEKEWGKGAEGQTKAMEMVINNPLK